jgi:hypothetical protein
MTIFDDVSGTSIRLRQAQSYLAMFNDEFDRVKLDLIDLAQKGSASAIGPAEHWDTPDAITDKQSQTIEAVIAVGGWVFAGLLNPKKNTLQKWVRVVGLSQSEGVATICDPWWNTKQKVQNAYRTAFWEIVLLPKTGA